MTADSLPQKRSLARWWLFALAFLSIVFALWRSEFGFHPQYEVLVDVTADGKAVVAYAVRRMTSVLQAPFRLVFNEQPFQGALRIRDRLVGLRTDTGESIAVVQDRSFERQHDSCRQPSLDCAEATSVFAVSTPRDYIEVYDARDWSRTHESRQWIYGESTRRQIAVSSDGAFVARTASFVGPVVLAMSSSPPQLLMAPSQSSGGAALTPDNKLLVHSLGGGINTAPIGTGNAELRLLMPFGGGARDIAFTRDGRHLVAMNTGDLVVWDAGALTSVDKRPQPPPPQWEKHYSGRPSSHYPLAHVGFAGLSRMSLSPESSHVALSSHRGLTIYRLPGLEVEREIARFDLTDIAFGPTSDTIVLGDKAGRVSLLEWRTGRVVWSRQAIEAPAVSFPIAFAALVCWCFAVAIDRANARRRVRHAARVRERQARLAAESAAT